MIPSWKKWLSYIVEWHIESAPSEINPHLYVSLKNGRFQLCTAKAIYSYGDLYDNFSKSFQMIDLKRIPGKNVLLLGLGLGSVPYMLERKFDRQFHYTAVEIDEHIIYLADKYCLQELASPIQTICTDALVFVEQTTERYDMIAMDIFLDDIVPEQFQTTAFLEQLKSLLNPGGVLLFNRLALNKKDLETTEAFFKGPFSEVFPDGGYLEVGGNWMLLNSTDFLI